MFLSINNILVMFTSQKTHAIINNTLYLLRI